MKKSLISGLFMALCAITMVSCQKENENENTKVFKSFTASVEESQAKTTLNGSTNIYWNSDDSISVICATRTSVYGTAYSTNNDVLYASNVRRGNATFSGDVTTTTNGRHIALYPANSAAEATNYSLAGITATVPSQQTAIAGSFDPKANIMTASASNDETVFEFKNVCSYLKIHSPHTCTSIQIIANGTNMIAGTFSANIATDGTPSNITAMGETFGGSKYIRLTGNIVAGQDYYVAVLPGTLTGGFTLKFWHINGEEQNITYNSNVTSSLTLQRGYIYSLTNFADDHETHIIPDGAIDLDLPSGTLWASSNVDDSTATGLAALPADFGSYFRYGDTVGHLQTEQLAGGSSAVPSFVLDAATHWCGNDWRIPTAADFTELLNYCTWTWDSQTNTAGESVNGYTVTGANGNSIFIPAAGSFYTEGYHYAYPSYYYTWTSTYTRYWSSTIANQSGTTTNYIYMFFNSTEFDLDYYMNQRWPAFPIRPVVNQ